MVELRPLCASDMPYILGWRRHDPSGASTTWPITEDAQYKWYVGVVCNRDSEHRYWAVLQDGALVGITGLTYLDRDNRRAEVALMVDPEMRGCGIGERALMLVLEQAFDNMDLEQVYGEVYGCNKYLGFWVYMVEKHGWYSRVLPQTKRWAGRRWDSTWFCCMQEDWGRMRR